jgi:hypothetical protein
VLFAGFRDVFSEKYFWPLNGKKTKGKIFFLITSVSIAASGDIFFKKYFYLDGAEITCSFSIVCRCPTQLPQHGFTHPALAGVVKAGKHRRGIQLQKYQVAGVGVGLEIGGAKVEP